jgi:hypothetical protein
MINGIAILNWPVSAVTINVAKDATDKDHQRCPLEIEDFFCADVICNLRGGAGGSRFDV